MTRPPGATDRQGLTLHLAVFATTDAPHNDPIGTRDVPLPIELLDPLPAESGEDTAAAIVARLGQRLGWGQLACTIERAIREITAGCPACGGSTLCAVCVGDTTSPTGCLVCSSSGRCPTCSPALQPAAIAAPAADQ